MAVKKVKEETIKKEETKLPDGEYFYAVGKRKTSIAQVRIYPASKAPQGVVVNGRNFDKYFT
jgi:small subunit ribosomal protein S9